MIGHRNGKDDLQGAESGATLLELLVYLALASLVLVTANEGLQLTRNLAARAVATAGRASTVELRLRRLRDTFAAATDDSPFHFAGSVNAITFGGSGAVLALRTTAGSGGVRLEQISPNGATAVIVDRAASVAFAFRSLRPKDTGWLGSWSIAGAQPQLVRITVRPQAPGDAVETVLSLEPPFDQTCIEGGACAPEPKEQAP